MGDFRFSPVSDPDKLLAALEYIHLQSHRLCSENLGYLLPVAGNIGFFCHFDDEFEKLTTLRKELTDLQDNWNQKYYRLYKPIVFAAKDGIPETTYTYLYVRKPDADTPHVGDVDFYLKPDEYAELKKAVMVGKFKKGVKMFERPDLDMVRLYDPNIDVSAFVHSYDIDFIVHH